MIKLEATNKLEEKKESYEIYNNIDNRPVSSIY